MIRSRILSARSRKLLLAALASLGVCAAAPSEARADSTGIAYFGTNLFLGIAYHRWGCAFDSNWNVTTNDTYQGFTQTQYCHAGWSWSSENSSASTYYGYTTSGNVSDVWLGYYFCCANYDYGEALTYGGNGATWQDFCHSWEDSPQYSNNSTADRTSRDPSGAINHCSYNVLTNCNSDCWIGDFSSRQGTVVPTLSPCL